MDLEQPIPATKRKKSHQPWSVNEIGKGDEGRASERNIMLQVKCSMFPQQPSCACRKCKVGLLLAALFPSCTACSMPSCSWAYPRLAWPWMEKLPITSVKRALYPQENVGEQNLDRAMISLPVCIGCLLSYREESWPLFPLFWFSVFITAPGVISHLPRSWFKCLTQSHMFGSLIQSKIWPTSCENSLYHMCCKA